MNEKEKVLDYIKKYQEPETIKRNRMGCNESWYEAYYAIKETFTVEEIEAMSEKEVENLVKLAWEISGALY